MKALGAGKYPDGSMLRSMLVRIEEGADVQFSRSHGHFAGVNVLGMMALQQLRWSPVINWAKRSFVLTAFK
ncbi:unnamed protein product [Vitrella brassicaformis CCMP3155]|uniref:Uncharacterized protein n=1 Tax=Vitrella brassicaformis (strain CCMP3155) TaxID=1169540 RepID=A0A0G4FCN2_VITBC|nr:unnamed protein product [Vitrella brassicaformis CCMP3155]|eukprot:CEM10991.1 unnamed protein product [Vitrella brassicaformis CCMP3155]